jgi:hypothetical protein
LILPSFKETVKVILSPVARKGMMKMPLSNKTVGRRIPDMPENIKHNVNENLRIAEKFCLKLNETTDSVCVLHAY